MWWGGVALAALATGVLAIPVTAQGGPCVETLQHRVDTAPVGATINVPACTYHEQVVLNRALTLDGRNQAVIDGDNVRERWVWIASSDVTIRNFTMRNASTPLSQGGIGTQAGISRIVIDHNDLGPTSNGAPVGIGGTTDSRVSGNAIHGGGQLGVIAVGNTRLVLQGNHVYGNNTAGVDPGFAAGGIKAVGEISGQILGNEVNGNNGPGIWCDIGCTGEVIAGNAIHDQQYNPIFYEVSTGGDIHDNTITNAPSGPLDWGCIVVSSSGTTAVHNNTCNRAMALLVILDNRGDLPPDAGRNVRVQDNTVLSVVPDPLQASPLAPTRWWQWSASGPLVVGQNGNLDSGNTSAVPTATPVPSVTCEVKVRLGGVEGVWKPCL
jgi:hypothetical protein